MMYSQVIRKQLRLLYSGYVIHSSRTEPLPVPVTSLCGWRDESLQFVSTSIVLMCGHSSSRRFLEKLN